MAVGGDYQGQEFATGWNGFRSVIVAESGHDMGLMYEAASGILGFSVDPVPEEQAVEVFGTCAREIGDWARSHIDDGGPVPESVWYYNEDLARQHMIQALKAGGIAVRIVAQPVGDEYPNTGTFYQRYYALRDAETQPEA